jgi:CheY-like chemotaxis protein
LKPVLIIDDDQRNTFALSAVLKAEGYEVIAAGNMAEAFVHWKTVRTILASFFYI